MDSLLRNLRRKPKLMHDYDAEISELGRCGIVSRIEFGEGGFYTFLTHHPVIREDKVTTKIRQILVFDNDASAKGRNGIGLNDCFYIGNNFNPDLMTVKMRFKTRK